MKNAPVVRGWWLLLAALVVCACASDDDDAAPDAIAGENGAARAAVLSGSGDAAGDDDVPDDDTGDDEPIPEATPNPDARADAFRLFYRERAERVNLALNRFVVAGDVAFATAFGKLAVARAGNAYEVVPGPNDNNPIGFSTFTAWKMYQAIGGRPLELTLIRLFEGLAFNEAVSGHPGITCREALPGWTRVVDGISGTVTRTRGGLPIDPPVTFPPELESEIISAFYNGLVFTYREDPLEYYFALKPINELEDFSVTMVFPALPRFLRISDCCSSWMIPPRGTWQGAYWGNHNSRDNFSDYVQGYLAALEAERTDGLPEDLARAAAHAAEAVRRTGDRIVEDGYILKTVSEWYDYETLVPAGERGPDGYTNWQDLGSLASCPMAYAARAISSRGLHSPVPEIPLPGAVEVAALKDFFARLGIDLPLPTATCKSLDDAFVGLGWGEILRLEVLGMPWYELAEILASVFPDLFYNLLGRMMDDFQELVLGAVNLCSYARIMDEGPLLDDARRTLWHLVRMQRILAGLVYRLAADPASRTELAASMGEEEVVRIAAGAEHMVYMAALYARMFGIDAPMEDFGGFAIGDGWAQRLESYLSLPDTAPWPLISDDEIFARVEQRLAGEVPSVYERYRNAFGMTPPVRRAAGGYEAIGVDGRWRAVETPRHVWVGDIHLWPEVSLCTLAPETLDCSWARLGCAPADLDGSGRSDEADAALFNAAWATFGEGATCSAENAWCDGADLDRSGTLDPDDRAFLAAAEGCVR